MQKNPMKTYAVGRFLIDLPVAAVNVSMSQKILGTDVMWKKATLAQYDALISKRVSELNSPDPATKLLISDSAGAVPNSRIILFEGNARHDELLQFEAFRFVEEVGGYFFLNGPVERLKIGIVNPSVNEVFKLIQPHTIDPKMTELGTCLDHAFVSGADPKWEEDVVITADLGDISIMFNTAVIDGLDDEPSLLKQAEVIAGFPAAKVLRKERRQVAGLNGAELAFIDIPQASTAYSLQWQYEGRLKSVAAPRMIVSMSSNVPMSMPQEELLGLWDVMLTSIRLRPGSV